VAPRVIEDEYSVADAVVVGNLLISLLRHGDRVTAACQAQLVNVIAPIRTEPGGPAWRQTIFHPFAKTAALARGDVLRTRLTSPTYDTARYGEVPVVDAIATHDAETGDVVVFAVNRDQNDPVELTVDLRQFPEHLRLAETHTLTDDDLTATNTREAPDRVVPRPNEHVSIDGATLKAVLPRVSWTAIRLNGAEDER
jgi:alpha-N-arabinofuranosidase